MSDQNILIAILVLVSVHLAICLIQMWNSSRSSATSKVEKLSNLSNLSKPMEPYDSNDSNAQYTWVYPRLPPSAVTNH